MQVNLDCTYTEAQDEVFFGELAKYNIVTKGRRLGFTRGAAQACIEYALDGVPYILWGDTINGNIDRYYERYFLPLLKQLPKAHWHWNQQKRELSINETRIDFRSADRPENWEGFGYKVIILNEAGIILSDSYLYVNAILPMMLDYPDSKLIAGGVPKGKFNKDGSENIFYTLYKRAKTNEKGNYKLFEFTSFDNPFLTEEDINQLIEEVIAIEGIDAVDQEVYGKFIEKTGLNAFMTNYKKEKHESKEAIFREHLPIKTIIDFNINPFAVDFAHIWEDKEGKHCHIFDSADIQGGSIPAMADLIMERYGKYLFQMQFSGDQTGDKRDISQRDHSSYWKQLFKELKLNYQGRLKLPTKNPEHSNSRGDCNYVMYHFPDFKINPEKCPHTVRDCKIVQCDAFGQIIKRERKKIEQQGDHLDNVRYLINTFLLEWVDRHKK